jgi:hypothetical protein
MFPSRANRYSRAEVEAGLIVLSSTPNQPFGSCYIGEGRRNRSTSFSLTRVSDAEPVQLITS